MEVAQEHAERFLSWLLGEAVADGRGTRKDRLDVAPKGKFWLGRLAPQERVQHSALGERAERLDPCEVGFRVRPVHLDGRPMRCHVRLVAWREIPGAGQGPGVDKWKKTEAIDVPVEIRLPGAIGDLAVAGRDDIATALSAVGAPGLAAEVHAEVEAGKDGPQLALTVVNVSPEERDGLDTNLYEVEFQAEVGPTEPFVLDDLPDSFRYDRHVPAYGMNGGVEDHGDGSFATTDFAWFDERRPDYWDVEGAGAAPEFTMRRLSEYPAGAARELATRLREWTEVNWSEEALRRRQAEHEWSQSTLDQALEEAGSARGEVARVERGVALLERDDQLRRAFALSNRAFLEAPGVEHDTWRPFQLGFVLANLAALVDDAPDGERAIVDTLWFATGGGKTETYLLLTLTAAFHDRLRGKLHGITSWGRFPLRMLSLQQTQRFADVLAAAELVRQREELGGDEFSLGFLVGEAGSPNSIPIEPQLNDPDHKDPQMPARYRVLIRCPFCLSKALRMTFDQHRWALDHVCDAEGCPWRGRPLPFRIVDEEIYRFLPTVVLGTLDKAASIAIQAAMRGFYGPPRALCANTGHGFTYAPRWNRSNGCLFPGCTARPPARGREAATLGQDPALFAPTIRMQDELHLLRDALGSIDSHYEALLDALQRHWGSEPKLIASSATLSGHAKQVEALYRRDGRMFPLPGPWADHSFWSRASGRLARRYVGFAPRGGTLDFVNDRVTDTLQRSVRRALDEPAVVAREAGVPVDSLPELVRTYGVGVTYGSTLKDVEAAARSAESETTVKRLNVAMLTGRTPLDEVRSAIERLTNPEQDFDERIHLVVASSMLSHGVDIDRLNVMVMLGLPLSTSEFIQTTARVGRKHPGLVMVLHKIGRERDAAVFRIFPSFIEHRDRLVDPVPITAKSRRVLERTYAGIEHGRLLGIHEPAALDRGLRQLTRPSAVKTAFTRIPVLERDEYQAIEGLLRFDGPLDENLRRDLEEYVRLFWRNLNDPSFPAEFPSDLFPTGKPMRSLRDVESQVPVYTRETP